MYNLSTSYLVLFFLFSSFNPLPCDSRNERLDRCEILFQCGNIIAGFPFSGGNRQKDCGHPLLNLHCNKNNITSLFISNQEYSVLHIDQTSNTLTLAKQDLLGSFCSSVFTNTTLPPNIFELSPTYESVNVFYNCSSLPQLSSYTCPERGPISVSERPEYPETCNASFTLNIPTSFATKEKKLNLTNLESVLRKGFEVKAKTDEEACQECLSSRGRCQGLTLSSGFICRPASDAEGSCGYNQTSRVFVCYCKGLVNQSCSSGRTYNPWIIGSVSILFFIGVLVSLPFCFRARFQHMMGIISRPHQTVVHR